MMLPKFRRPRDADGRFVAVSWKDLALSLGPLVLLIVAVSWAAVKLLAPAPPSTLVISAGPPGSSYWNAAQKYKTILARNRIKVEVLPSEGSSANLRRLSDRGQKVDVGFVQSGIGPAERDPHLVSLGSVAYAPLTVAYRGEPITLLTELKGKRLALGAEGSGARELALSLLKLSGIEPGGTTTLLPLAGADAAKALMDGSIDAAFLAGESTEIAVLVKLVRTPGVQVFSFAQAEAYTRRLSYLTDITLPMGVYDLAQNLPPHDVHTLAPTVELVARDSLHPALSDLLIEAAREVHGRATILQRAGEFPSQITRSFPLSEDAARYYKSGKSFLYAHLPFWLASLADRLLFLLVPLLVVLGPGMKIVPALYSWRVRSRIYRWYGALLALERTTRGEHSEEERAKLLARLDEVEAAVNELKTPLSYAEQFYVLREHIGFVRGRLTGQGT
jgi:TRAP transporter TAXI family solute receptor